MAIPTTSLFVIGFVMLAKPYVQVLDEGRIERIIVNFETVPEPDLPWGRLFSPNLFSAPYVPPFVPDK
jgi:hypothetical protein